MVFSVIEIANSQEVTQQVDVVNPTFSETVSGLKVRSLSKKGRFVEQLVQFKNPQKIVVLKALVNGELFEVRDDGRVVIAINNNEKFSILLAEDGKSLGLLDKEAIKKIKINNRLRSQIRRIIANLELNSADASIRIQAIKTLSKSLKQDDLQKLKKRAEAETDSDVIDVLELVFALENLNNADRVIRLQGIEMLKAKTSLKAVSQLQLLVEKDSEGEFNEPDAEIRKHARSALVKIRSRLNSYEVAQTLFFGLSLGAVLVLAAIGLAITFGVMGVINMAHGEMMMLGAYTTYVMQQIMPNHIGLSLILAIPAAFMVSGIVGIGIERGIIRHLYGRPLETLLATFGVSLVLQQAVRSIFSPLNRSVITPEFMSGSLYINDFLSFTWNRLYILFFCLLVFAFLLQILKRTKLGLEVRAVSQNRNMAKAMGIPTARVDAMTFGLGSGIAGVAGVALSQITNVGPNLGQAYIVDSFMVVVFGGVGNLWGTLVAGFSLGIANKVLEPFAGAVLAKILVLVFIILFIQKRPRGLFPQKGRAAES